ncbi:MAG: GTP 3',8-cyclase MoaA [Lachnospiraceae bacterium]|nr:GTP 3',8-cyclase MoaA [Lachnospiraceae bacterium]
MTDGNGRKIEYLRVSVTDKCNFRCRYCMPKEGIRHLQHQDVLSFEEIRRLAEIMKDMGVRKIRLTGGEPLVRKGVVSLVSMLPGAVYMTTNGCMLPEYAGALKEAGLCGVNISLDTLDRNTFCKLTGRDELDLVLRGINAAREAGLPVKLNCVPIKGINEGEIEALCDFAARMQLDIRFIELMPIGCMHDLTGIPSDEIIKKLGTDSLEPIEDADTLAGPAQYFKMRGFATRIGFISPMSHRFCNVCNRIRLTADGYLKTCLQYATGADLRALLRGGADDKAIWDAIESAVRNKPSAHTFGSCDGSDIRRMVQIGG